MGRDFRVILVAAAVLLVGMFAVAAGAQGRGTQQANRGQADAQLVERGAYLVRAAGCGDCHTPVRMDEQLGVLAPDTSRAFSGHPQQAPKPGGTLGKNDIGLIGPTFTSFRLPFGTVYAVNLTPHETGIGSWTEQQFVQAMRTGMHRGMENARPILPPMPWTNLAGMTDRDLRAMWAYFRSLPPIDNAVPQPEVEPAVYEQFTRAWRQIRQGQGQPAQQQQKQPPR